MIERRGDWHHQLWNVVKEYRSASFCYGSNDCTLFLARCVDAMTGSGFTAELSAAYHDARGAVRFLRSEGGLEAAISKRLGEPVLGCGARRGDAILLTRHAVGVSFGHLSLALLDKGFLSVPTQHALMYWRVG